MNFLGFESFEFPFPQVNANSTFIKVISEAGTIDEINVIKEKLTKQF